MATNMDTGYEWSEYYYKNLYATSTATIYPRNITWIKMDNTKETKPKNELDDLFKEMLELL